jgi:hypothetical protein
MEDSMSDDSSDRAREDIAFIRRAVEQGRGYAGACGFDMLIWGVAVAAAYLGTYATVKGWWRVQPNLLWAVCIVLPWLYSLRGMLRRLLSGAAPAVTRPPITQALRMLWLGCGIFLSTFAVAVIVAGEMRQGWFNAVSAGILGIAFFVSSYLCNLSWMRIVAVGWWIAALSLYALHHHVEVLLPAAAALMLVLLALPGFVLWRRRRPASTTT